ncbi:MAG: hypothetical protein IKI11_05715 [Neisseriaceae bacterium]|nr:hypothetical protein [Neisseriaceae bacterium]
MENVVYYFLIVFGAILVWISCNDLRKLKENNAQWAEIERQSHLYNQDNYAEAEKLVKKLQKIIPFLAKFSLFNGVFAIVGSLLGILGLFNNINFDLFNWGCFSIFLIFISMAILYHFIFNSALSLPGVVMRFNKRYFLIIHFVKDKVNSMIGYYFRNSEYNGKIGIFWNTCDTFSVDDEDYYTTEMNIRKVIMLCLCGGIFLFQLSIFLDINFRQMNIDFFQKIINIFV